VSISLGTLAFIMVICVLYCVLSDFEMTSVVHDFNSHSPLFTGSENSTRPSEQEMVQRLTDAGYNGRDDALEWLKASIRQCDGVRVPFADPLSVFRGLTVALEDSEWDTRYQCTKVIGDIIPLLDKRTIEQCMHEVLAPMVRRLGDTKVTISSAAVSTLSKYAKCTADIQILYDAILYYGLQSDDDKLKLSVAESVPSLLEASNCCHLQLQHLVSSLIELTSDTHFLRPVEVCLHKISSCIGTGEFDACVNQLPASAREKCLEIMNGDSANSPEIADVLNGMSVEHDDAEDSISDSPVHVSHEDLRKSHVISVVSEKADILYGFIPSRLVSNLCNHDDNKAVSRAIEELRMMVFDSKKVDQLQSHMTSFLNFLRSLLDDGVSFQVVVSRHFYCVMLSQRITLCKICKQFVISWQRVFTISALYVNCHI